MHVHTPFDRMLHSGVRHVIRGMRSGGKIVAASHHAAPVLPVSRASLDHGATAALRLIPRTILRQ